MCIPPKTKQVARRKKIMRKEFYIGTEEDMTDYMERAAAYLRSIKKGTLIDGGINLPCVVCNSENYSQ